MGISFKKIGSKIKDTAKKAGQFGLDVNSGKVTLKLAKEAAQGTARSAAGTVASALGRQEEIVPKNKAQKAVFGSEPFMPLTRRVTDLEIDLQRRGLGKASGPLAGIGVIGMTALDLIPATSGKAKLGEEAAEQVGRRLLPKLGERILPKLGRAAESAADNFTEAALKKASLGEHLNVLNRQQVLKPTASNKNAFKQAVDTFNKLDSEAGFADPGKINRDIRTQLEDRLYPIRELTKGKVKPDSDPYVQARLFAGHNGRVQNKLDELRKVALPAKDKLADAEKYARLETELERAGHGMSTFEGGRTLEQIKAEKAAFDARPDVGEISATVQKLRDYDNRQFEEFAKSGFLSPDDYAKITSKHQKYASLQRAEYLAEHGDHLPAGSRFSVGSQNVLYKAKGSEKKVADSMQARIDRTYKITALVERNKVATKMADLSKLPDFKDVVVPLKGEVPSGMGKFSVFRNGVKEDYAVPKEIEDALKHVGVGEADLVSKIMNNISTKPLRLGATSLNVPFLGSNVIRDFTSAKLNSKVGFSVRDWIGGLASVLKKDDAYKQFLDSGASFSGFFEGAKSLPKTAKALTRGKLIKATKSLNPVRLIQQIGEVAEMTPRVGVFKRGLRKGLGTTEAAFNARNATVDFAKSGSALKVVNMWVPFLNARLQGTLNTARAFKDRPLKSAFVTSYMVGLPAIATYLNNTRNFKEIWDDIAGFEKQNNFLIIYGDARDEDGNPTQVIKIPKPDVGRIVGNPLENFLSYLDKEDTRPLSEMAVQMFSDISPVGFERDGEISGQAALSGTLPPIVKAGVESVTNKNMFTGYDIVPQRLKDASPEEQYKSTTSPFAVKLGQATKTSPLQIENAAGTLFGGLGRQLINPKEAGTKMSGRFVGARGGAQDKKVEQSAEQFLQEQEDQDAQIYRQAEKVLKDFETLPNAAEEFAQLKKADPRLAKKVADLKRQRDLGFTSKDFVIQDLGVENGMRAKFIYQELNKLQSKEEKAALWEDLKNKKLISKEVSKQLQYLLKEEGN